VLFTDTGKGGCWLTSFELMSKWVACYKTLLLLTPVVTLCL